MNLLLLYCLLTKATMTTFSGLSSLPIVRHDMVVHYRVLTDLQLNAAVAAGQTAPGPNGLYLVSVGYFVEGIPGAIAGALAVMTPAFLILPLLVYIGRRADRPEIRSAIQCVALAAAGLIARSTILIGRDSVTDGFSAAVAAASFAWLAFTRQPTAWAILAAAAAGLAHRLWL